ncbi:IS66 family transposase, partial [Burkholderia ubonensis]|uniref:IS66 family transposase n=1 Tax=Burkholderia ubonensis TaxID=101571 RepID=UPI000A681E72
QYMSGQWPKLVRSVGHGNWPISNNLCENAIRPFVVGRKGWLFTRLPVAATADDYADLIPWRMPAALNL